MSSTNTTDNTPAKNDGFMRRAIQMSSFRHKAAIAAAVNGNRTKLGSILGVAYGAVEKISTPPGASEPSRSWLITGKFECVVDHTGEVFEAGSCYLPNYFADELRAVIGKSADSVNFAIEIWMEPNARSSGDNVASVPYQYAVKNLVPNSPNDPLQQLKMQLARAGALPKGLPAPLAIAGTLAGPSDAAGDAVQDDGQDGAQDGQDGADGDDQGQQPARRAGRQRGA